MCVFFDDVVFVYDNDFVGFVDGGKVVGND